MINEDEILISVISVYNDSKVLEEQLGKSLKNQNCRYEWIPVANDTNRFSSAASALNEGASKAKGEVLIFLHQDIFFKTENELKLFGERILSHDTGTIVGAAGAVEKEKQNIGVYTSGVLYDSNCLSVDWKEKEVSCVDEFCFGMKRSTFEQHSFDEKLCDNWHLYAVEACLYWRKHGGRVMVVPVQVHHFSKGTISLNYMQGLKRLADYYRSDFCYIWTTCYKVSTSKIWINGLLLIWYLNRKIRRRPV